MTEAMSSEKNSVGDEQIERVVRLNLKKYQHDLISAISVLNMETVEEYVERAVIQSLHADLDGGGVEQIKCHASDWKKRLHNDGL